MQTGASHLISGSGNRGRNPLVTHADDRSAADYATLYGAIRSIRAVAGDALEGCATHHDLLSALRAVHAVAVDAIDGTLTVRA